MVRKILVLVFVFAFVGCATTEEPKTTPESKGVNVSEEKAPAAKAPEPKSVSIPEGKPEDLYRLAEEAFNAGRYDETVAILNKLAMDDPTSWKVMTLRCKADLERAAILKAQGDDSYEDILKQCYRTAKLLRKMNMYHPDPYYIAAKVHLVKGTPERGVGYMEKAVELAPGNSFYTSALEEMKAVMQASPKLPHSK